LARTAFDVTGGHSSRDRYRSTGTALRPLPTIRMDERESMVLPPLLDLNEVRSAIHDFNRDANNVAWDTALHQAVEAGGNLNSVPLVIFAVNYFWRANVQLSSGTLPFYCEKICRDVESFRHRFGLLRSYGLPIWDEELLRLRVVDPSCDLLMDLLGRPDGSTHYAFATKLLLWLADVPPFDSRVRTAILRLTSVDLEPSNRSRDEIREKYSQLLEFYNCWLKQIHDARLQDDLIEYDFVTQPDHLRLRNSLVRVVDKYFWLRGEP
jgi:hypothetical protein